MRKIKMYIKNENLFTSISNFVIILNSANFQTNPTFLLSVQNSWRALQLQQESKAKELTKVKVETTAEQRHKLQPEIDKQLTR